jgi:membrane-bound lytic murein transglycosylase F
VSKGAFVRTSPLAPALLPLFLLLTAAPAASPTDLPEIEARGSLRVIAAEGEQPEMFDFDGDPAKPGLEREMLEGFARLKRLNLEIVPVKAFSDRIPALLRGEGDVIVGLVDTAERRKQIAFTAEVLPVRHIVVTHKPGPPVRTVGELRKRKAGTIKGTTWARETLAAGVPESQVEYFPDTEPMLEALSAGRVDAVVMTLSDFVLATDRHPGLEGGMLLGEPAHAAWGLRKRDAKLRADLDAYIANLRSGASWNRLIVTYFGDKALSALGRATPAR